MEEQMKLRLQIPSIKIIYKKIPVAKIHYLDIDDDILELIQLYFDKINNDIFVNMEEFKQYNENNKYRGFINFYNSYKEFEYIIITFNNTK